MKSEDVKVYYCITDSEEHKEPYKKRLGHEEIWYEADEVVLKSDYDTLSLALKKAEKEIKLLREQRNNLCVGLNGFDTDWKRIENCDAEIKKEIEAVK